MKEKGTKTKFMLRAIELSQVHMRAGHGGPFGCVIVKKGKIIGEGWNQVTSKKDPTAHAEVMAIRQACQKIKHFELKGCQVYTSCEPCPMCLAALYWARVDKIYFANTRKDAARIGFDDDFIYKEIKLSLKHRTIPVVQICQAQATPVFDEWQSTPDKMRY